MAKSSIAEPTTRAYTLKLSGNDNWRELLWKTHVAVNRGAQVWGDWLLTLRGGLPAILADDHPERRVLLALSWMSVESPASMAPKSQIVATGRDLVEDRCKKIEKCFRRILERLDLSNQEEWITSCLPALTARIREDAVWVDRSECFLELQKRHPGLNAEWASQTLFDFLGSEKDYFSMPDDETPASSEGKDFVQKAGGWLSRNWGAGEKSDSSAISILLARIANADSRKIVGKSGSDALAVLLKSIDQIPEEKADSAGLLKQLKQAIGWKGRSSKGAMALEKIRDAQNVSADLWQQTVGKLNEESASQANKNASGGSRPAWMDIWRKEMESRLGMPYRTHKDLIWEHGVTLDHALRRVSAAHTWIKRAEVERRRFRENASKIESVPPAARQWLDTFCETRSADSGALGEYIIRKRAIDGWDKIIQAWDNLGSGSTRKQRIAAARDVQANLDDNEKFGDIQLFAGFGDEEEDSPRPCLADDAAICTWQDADGKSNTDILKDYVDATVADNDQRRFKVPAYRHPDPLRHPVYIDFGNSRWAITYSALKAHQDRVKNVEQLVKAKTDKAREKLRLKIEQPSDLRGVALDVWNGETTESLPLRWHGKRLWNDIDLEHFGSSDGAATVSRADRLGRIVATQSRKGAVSIAEVFGQKDWNGRLQVPRQQLDHLADLVYGKENGKRIDPDFSKLDKLHDNSRAHKMWERLNWFLTTSAKLQPQGPWLDYVEAGLPDGIEFKKGRNGYFLNYAANKERKGRARLQLARLPGLRVLSLDLGHRYAAACAVWETITRKQMFEACREAGHPEPKKDELYIHLRRLTDKKQKSGRNKGQAVTETTVYRRIGPDVLPDGSAHPAPWARLERQFLIRLQGEDRPARPATSQEIGEVNNFRQFLGLPLIVETPMIDDLQRDAVRIARLGLRRLGDAARIGYAMTATTKPMAGGRERELTRQQRVEYLQDALILWQGLATSNEFQDKEASNWWKSKIMQTLAGPQPVEIADDVSRSERKKKIEATREPLRAVAEQLADPQSEYAKELNRLWAEEWERRKARWQQFLRWLRRFVLPRAKEKKQVAKRIRRVGGLSVKRLQTIRDLYQVLKAFHMRPEPHKLQANVPELGDESLANFGRRILNQLERLREQRIKQLASRVIEAALGAGRMKKTYGRDSKRPELSVDRPCHAVVVEDLERYRPEDSRLRRENRQLMNWAARNVRKYIVEGCELHGLHFVEVPPAYSSRQDSRTGAPGIRCEDVCRKVLEEAAHRVRASSSTLNDGSGGKLNTKFEREVRRWMSELNRVRVKSVEERNPREQVLYAISENIASIPANCPTIRLPRRGGELFVSVNADSPLVHGVQADINAAANLGLKALMDPDWNGAWWFVLVNLATKRPTPEKVQGCPLPFLTSPIWSSGDIDEDLPQDQSKKHSKKSSKRKKTDVYAWNSLHWRHDNRTDWLGTKPYWEKVEQVVAERLLSKFTQSNNPF